MFQKLMFNESSCRIRVERGWGYFGKENFGKKLNYFVNFTILEIEDERWKLVNAVVENVSKT